MAKKEIFEYSKFKPLTTKEDYALWLELSRKGVTFKGLDICLTLWRKSPNSLSSHMLPKFVNAYKVYRNHEKYDLFKSFFLVINLSLHYLKKILKQKNYEKNSFDFRNNWSGRLILSRIIIKKELCCHGIKS